MTFTSYFIYVAKVLNNAHYLDRDLNMKRFVSRLNGSSVPATINSTIIDRRPVITMKVMWRKRGLQQRIQSLN
jgi:hypothetical protein